MRYYISHQGKRYGPFEIPKIQQLLEKGKINEQAQVCGEGEQEWQPLRSIIPPSPAEPAISGTSPSPPPPPPPQIGTVPMTSNPGAFAGTDPALAILVPVGRTATSVIAGYLGIVSIFLGFPGPISVIVGILALKELNASPEKLGHGRAWFGIIAGIIGTLWATIWITILVLNS